MNQEIMLEAMMIKSIFNNARKLISQTDDSQQKMNIFHGIGDDLCKLLNESKFVPSPSAIEQLHHLDAELSKVRNIDDIIDTFERILLEVHAKSVASPTGFEPV